MPEHFTFLYTEPQFSHFHFAAMSDDRLAGFTERHKIDLGITALQPTRDVFAELVRGGVNGLVIGIPNGWIGFSCLRLARRVLRSGHKVWFYWKREHAIECIDSEHLRSYWRLWFVSSFYRSKPKTWSELSGRDLARQVKLEIENCITDAAPLPIPVRPHAVELGIDGVGVYLRMDFWNPSEPGSCPKALSEVVLPSPGPYTCEDDLLRANAHYLSLLRTALQELRPAFIYERICADNFCGARLSQELQIPYVVEYNGSDRSGYRFTELYSRAEELSFRQATAIAVASDALKQDLIKRHIPSEKILVSPDKLSDLLARRNPETEAETIKTGDAYKDQVQNQWNNNPCGSQYVKHANAHTLDWYFEVQRYRHEEYAPWMPEVMEFSKHSGKQLLEIGGGLGTDLSQFAVNGAQVTDLDLSAGHLALAQENFRLRGLTGRFIHHDAETLPFDDNSFDVIYSNGVIHHTPNTANVVSEMYRVLKPGGRIIVMVYAENSWHYWMQLVRRLGLIGNMLRHYSMAEIMSRTVEMTANGARPLVKVYTRTRLRNLFAGFEGLEVLQRQITAPEVPRLLRAIPTRILERWIGWNLVIKANKPMLDGKAETPSRACLPRSA